MKGLEKMTVTFQNGQFFHPYYGWFDKEPDLPDYMYRSGLVNEKIGEEHRLTPDNPLYEAFNNSSGIKALIERMEANAEQRAANADPAYVYEPRDLSYYLDGQTKFAGSYSFVYKNNTVSAVVDFQPARTNNTADTIASYEKERQKILDLKKQGFHDDAVNMLLKALDEAFVNVFDVGLSMQLGEYSKNSDQVQATMKAFFLEYLRVRIGADPTPIKTAMTMAANNLINRGQMDHRVNVNITDPRTLHLPQSLIDQLDAAWAVSSANIPKPAPLVLDPNRQSSVTWDPADTHIRDVNRWIPDYSKNAAMSDIEKEARTLSIVFRVRGDQMIDYARRYEEISGELDRRLNSGEISASDYDRYRTDLNTAFIKTHNLNIKGQAMAAGLSESKATELAIAFSEEYIKIREQTGPNERNADKIANTALQKLAAQGWPSFSLYTSENRATVAANDPWYAMMSEDALYWQSNPQKYLQYSLW